MNLRGPASPDSEDINLTPLIDVVFLLLIFFMVSTTFERQSQLEIELPQANVEPTPREPEVIEVSIDAKGRYYVDGRQLVNTQVETVKQAILVSAGGAGPRPIAINADGAGAWQSVVTVMDAARQIGFVQITFATRHTSEGSQ